MSLFNSKSAPFIYLILLVSFTSSLAAGNIFTDSLHHITRTEKHPLLTKAESFYELRQFDKAINHCLAALYELDGSGDAENIVTARNLLGASYIKVRSFDKALSSFNEGLRIAMTNFPADHHLVGESHHHLGVYYDQIGNAEKSISHHQQALNIRIKNFGNDHLKVAESYIGLGEVYLYTVLDFKKANTYFDKSVQILENHLEADHLDLYVAYFYVAQVNRRLGDNDKALTFAFKALSVINSRKEYHAYLERCYTLLGDIYYSQTEFEKAIEYLNKGIAQSAVTDGMANYNLIRKYTNLGVAYGEMNQSTLAVSCFKKSLHIYDKHDHHNSELQAENFLHLGRIFQKAGESDSAMFYLAQCLKVQLSDYGPKHSMTSEAYRYLAKFFQDSKDLDTAALYIQRSLVAAIGNFNTSNIHINPAPEEIDDRYDLFQLFGSKGSILLDLYWFNPKDVNNLTSALACFKIADDLMEVNRNAYQREESKLFFADHYHNIYEKALQVSYLLFGKTKDQQYFADALRFMEKSKAFLLAESLNKAEIFNRVGLPDSIREMERSLNSALAAYRSLLESNNQKTNSEAGQQGIQSQIFQISQKQQKLLNTIAQQYPNYFQIKYQKLSPLQDVLGFAKKNNSTIIEYFWGEENVYVLALSEEKMIFKEVPEVDSLEQSIMQYFQILQKVPQWNEEGRKFQTFFSSAHRIYSELLAPVLENMNPEKLIIIRDGPLLLIPFESLPVSKTNSNLQDYQMLDYLIKRNTISYAHSADLLVKSSSRAKTKPAENKVLAFSYSQLTPSEANGSNQSASELPGTAREINAISQILPGLFFQGEEATEQRFKTYAGNFDILHLAVHGKADPEKQLSGTLFFKQSQDTEEDGELHVYELYDLNLKARLTVLSACESGVGKLFRGEGVFNIARGFAYAGCPSTVMTLWPISDIASAQIMADFYRELNEGKEIDESLRIAKLNYLENADSKLAHPAFWAAYIPTGNMESVVDSGSNTITFWTLIVVGIVFFSGFLILWNWYLRKPQTLEVKNTL